MNKDVCPECLKDDQVAAVPAIVAGGVSTSVIHDLPAHQATSATALALALAPPPDPMDSAGVSWFAKGCAGFFGIGVILVCTISLWAIVNSPPSPILSYIVLFFPFAAVAAVPFTVFVVSRRRRAKARAKAPAWEAEIEAWKRSCYCFRNNLVFDPDTGLARHLAV